MWPPLPPGERVVGYGNTLDNSGQTASTPRAQIDTDSGRSERSSAASAFTAGRLAVCCERHGDVGVLVATGELDLGTADALREGLEALEASDATQIVVDFSALEFIDSNGVRLVIGLVGRAKAEGRQLRLRRGSPQVQRVFEITGVNGLLTFLD